MKKPKKVTAKKPKQVAARKPKQVAAKKPKQVAPEPAPQRLAITDPYTATAIIRRQMEPEKPQAEVVKGRWRVIKSLGSGGQGETLLVEDERREHTGQLVLKRLSSDRERALDRFSQEIRAIEKIQHPRIISVLDYGLPPDFIPPFYVMPFVPNGDLNASVDRFREDPVQVMTCFGRICEGVAAAHEAGIVHRDLKPENILFDADWNPIVADFGICFDLMDDHERFTFIKEKVGSRFFVAPELENGQLQDINATSDIYSLGKLLWFMLAPNAETLLFAREDWKQIQYNLIALRNDLRMRFLNEWIFPKTMVREPQERFKTVKDLVTKVEEVTKLLRDGFEPLSQEEMRCRFCGQGKYTPIGQIQLFYGFGPPIQGPNPWRGLACNVCGNLQLFRTDFGVALFKPEGPVQPGTAPALIGR